MEPDFWLERWHRGETGFHAANVNALLKTHWHAVAATPGAVFVPLCGKSLDMLWLAQQGFGVAGIELSSVAVTDFFAEAGLTGESEVLGNTRVTRAGDITLLCGDFFDLTRVVLGNVDYVYDRAALVALPPDTRPRYARSLLDLLEPGAGILLITLEYDQYQMTGPPFSVDEAEVNALFDGRCTVRRLAANDGALAENPKFRAKGLSKLTEAVYALQYESE